MHKPKTLRATFASFEAERFRRPCLYCRKKHDNNNAWCSALHRDLWHRRKLEDFPLGVFVRYGQDVARVCVDDRGDRYYKLGYTRKRRLPQWIAMDVGISPAWWLGPNI